MVVRHSIHHIKQSSGLAFLKDIMLWTDLSSNEITDDS